MPAFRIACSAALLLVLLLTPGCRGDDAPAPAPPAERAPSSPAPEAARMHPSWDRNGDGINDCEDEGTCDHTVDYTKPRPDAPDDDASGD